MQQIFRKVCLVLAIVSPLYSGAGAIAQEHSTSTQPSPDSFVAKSQNTPSLGEDYRKRYEALIKDQEERSKRADDLYARQEKLFSRLEVAHDRYEKILDTWEAQQKEYQQYLISLKKK